MRAPVLAETVVENAPQRSAGNVCTRGTRLRLARGIVAVAAVAALAVVGLSDPGGWGVELCWFHAITGWHCPACGAMRATHELLNGRVIAALHLNAAWVLLMLPLAVAAGSELLFGRGLIAVRREENAGPWTRYWHVAALLVGLGVFTLLRNLPWYPFVLLAPPG
jgi:hypothetical protein